MNVSDVHFLLRSPGSFLLLSFLFPPHRRIQAEEEHRVCQLECWRIRERWRHRVARGANCVLFLD